MSFSKFTNNGQFINCEVNNAFENRNTINVEILENASKRLDRGFSEREEKMFEKAKRSVLTKELVEKNLNQAYETVHEENI